MPKLITGIRYATTMEDLITITVDGKDIKAPRGSTLVDILRKNSYQVPTLCYHPDLPTSGGLCRVCLVADAKTNWPIIACKTKVQQGMNIVTQGEKIDEWRKTNYTFMMSSDTDVALSLIKDKNKNIKEVHNQMQEIAAQKGYRDIDKSTVIQFNPDLCIGCGRCAEACSLF